MKRVLIYILFFLVFADLCKATHNRAGYISYTWAGGNTYNFTITTYTNINPLQSTVDFCQLVLHFGDGDTMVANRINGVDPSSQCYPLGQGVVIVPNTTKLNVYTCSHTYNGPGTYWITMSNPNRNSNIDNIPNSVDIDFFIRCMLVIDPSLGTGHHDSPVLLNPPIDNGCLNQCFYYNPGAYSPDGDSLAYKLVPCLESGGPGGIGENIPGWSNPPVTAGGTYSLSPYNGDFEWCKVAPPTVLQHIPPLISEYNIAMIVEEWNQGFLVGEVELDMQIDIYDCNNTPPVFLPLNDTCVVAGTKLSFPVTAYATNDNVDLSGVGGPLSVFVKDSAIFPNSGYTYQTAKSTFSWNTECSHIREQPYLVTFKAINQDINHGNLPAIPLASYKTINISVVAPPVQNVKAVPSGSSMNITWTPSSCMFRQNDPYYNIYRKDTCANWQHAPCQTGVPPVSGYTYLDSTNSNHFTDTNKGIGLVRGVDYSYIIVAVYPDGSQSYASTQSCAHLVRDVPIITNVDVIQTDSKSGQIRIRWIKPLADSADLDTTKYHGPYQYTLLRDSGFGLPGKIITTFSSPYFAYLAKDTSYLDTLLNTAGTPYNYRIDFYANGDSLIIGSTDNASSVFLSISPALPGNILNLSWQEQVPWINTNYVIYRQNSVTQLYDPIGHTSLQTYSDSNLVNTHSYCYLVKSIGAYSDTSIPRPLINHSETKCAAPQDKQAPCPPVLNVTANCTKYVDSLVWTDPDNMNCGTHDVTAYRVYFTPFEDQPLHILYDTKNRKPIQPYQTQDTTYIADSLISVAGCYAVTAIDSFGNESVYSNRICVDNCPVYSLPNVFSPNGDGENDYFKPFPYKFVKDIDLQVYDRWGVLVFRTSDPDIHWDGQNMTSKQPVTDGTYFYVCVVNEIHYEGIVPRVLKGFIQIIQNKGDPQEQH